MKKRISTSTKRLTLTAFSLLFAVLPLYNALSSQSASALSGSDFKAGNIIDQAIFTNANAMSAQDIQNFLNSKVGSCDNNGSQIYSGSETRAQYDASIGRNTKFTCINQYYENTTTLANNLDGNPVPGGAISAAQIIYNAAQQYHINPEVIITTLQKEQGLVTDTWPWDSEYQAAMGYGCPDTAPCASQYYGFYNQVNDAAWQFRQYLTNPNNYNYVVGNDSIRWSPAASCGGSTVNIQNEATAALYNYTPYQPNAAALAKVNNVSNGGTGDSCSSYGNRNYWWYFNEWFGASAPSFQASYAGQSGYPTLTPGQGTAAFIRYENTGNLPWYDDVSAPQYNTYAVHLATSNPVNSASPFSAGWPANDRPATTFAHVYESDGVTLAADQHIAQPGEIVEFDFPITAPGAIGSYRQYFQPILEGSTMWNMGGEAWFGVTVQPMHFQASYAGQSGYPTLTPGQGTAAFIRYQNTGNQPWYDDASAAVYHTYAVHLATTNPINSASPFSAGWPTNNRATGTFAHVYQSDGATLAPDQNIAQPGQIVEFDFNFTASANQPAGYYQQYFQPILEGSTMWNMGGTAWLGVSVP